MKWELRFTETALNDLRKTPKSVCVRILTDWLATNFDAITPLPLAGIWQGFCKFRMSDWRVVYEPDWKGRLLHIHIIDNRKNVYSRALPNRVSKNS